MHNWRDISSGHQRSLLSVASRILILAFVIMPPVSALATPATWVYRTNFVDLWDSDEPCSLGSSIYITLATDTQADVGFEDGRRSLGYKSYPLKKTARYILALDDPSLPAPYLIIDEEDRLEAWHAPTDKAPVCVYAREE